MRKLIKGLAGLLAGTAIFLTSNQALSAANPNKNAAINSPKMTAEYAQKYTIKDSDIEREIRKWDDGMLGFIQNTAFVKTNLLQMLAAYQRSSQTVFVQLFHNGHKDLEQQIIGGIDHELSHALFDSPNGILSSSHYRGPRQSEIKAYVLKLYKSPKYRALISRIWDSCMTQTPEEKEFLAFIGGYTNLLGYDDEEFKRYEDAFNQFSNCDAQWFRQRSVGEIIARDIDSLMSTYLGPTTTNMWRLDWERIAFYTRFKLNGKQVFGKAIEKYDLARQLEKKGMPWQNIQEKLQYATSYTEDGCGYSWPENDFRFKQPLKTEINLEVLLAPMMLMKRLN
ncbi:hypothetical protein JW756_00890 [Candidatus Woesearchaeota archaeon]|nr:hypothetical protein [Candidatus Woesearchaeota archaeon]